MQRLHVHVPVANPSESIRFYAALFATGPSIVKSDYAKWMLNDPEVNFAISQRGAKSGLDHPGIQVESEAEPEELNRGLGEASVRAEPQKDAACCYAKSDKYRTLDPQGIAWEAFHTLTTTPVFGEDAPVPVKTESACCAAGELCR